MVDYRFLDIQNFEGGKIEKSIYIDPWFENPLIPKKEMDVKECELVLVTHGHFDHSSGAVKLLKSFSKAKCVCIFEVGEWLKN